MNPDVSGHTWPPPKTPDSPERPVPQMSDSGPAVYRQPPKKVSLDTRSKYVVHDQNRGGGGMATRYLATRSTAGPMQHHHQKDPGFHCKSIDHYYQPPPQGLEEDQSLNPHMERYQLMDRGPPKKLIGHHSSSDAEIDSLTCMLADLDSHPQNRAQNPDMSGPTWPPPKTLGSPERPVPQMSDSGPAVYRQPPKKVSSDARPKYVIHDKNRGGGGMATRYLATRSTAGPMQHHHQEDPGFHLNSNDHYYQPLPQGLDEDQSLNLHMDRYQLMHWETPEKLIRHHSSSDAETDSLTCMLADQDSHTLNGTQLYHNVPYNKYILGDHYRPSAQPGAPSRGEPFMGFPPQSTDHSIPPNPSDPHQGLQYFPQPDENDTKVSKSYPQPFPASYNTASTHTGPRFSLQVKTAQTVTYFQTGRQAGQAYTPPPHRQHALWSPPRNPTGPQGWFPRHPASQVQELHSERGYKGSAAGFGGRATQCPTSNGVTETHQSGSAPSSAYKPSKQGTAAPRPEEELGQPTKKFVYDMTHPPTEEDFGCCARCGDKVLDDGSDCITMEQVFHVDCFTCVTCQAHLRGQPFYAIDKQSHCRSCYISILERCCMCSKPILDRVLWSMGNAYHPRCFNCVVCGCCLDGVPFTVDATYQIHCIDDFHRKFAPRCSVCGQAIIPGPGQDETISIVALDRNFHVNCYVCEECGLLLSSEGEERCCYPLDGHILCKGCSAQHILNPSDKISTDC
ncbi:thyroid receptor-interacting protein 6-like isoform X14 [Oncorhynchus keta]|uniref:thyroid receptor-interacting protein 6-like isoform X14 n=1 Tax=Oncorhynchus keta TaxID=8018 RepID=UPI00227D1ECF|nr:thyroid receptor-interacting protein 6-like isoform X14 [Oncorhynchus keta]